LHNSLLIVLNYVELLEDFQGFKITPNVISFLLGVFESKDGSVSGNPFSITGIDAMLSIT
jgi:hypothetical protein